MSPLLSLLRTSRCSSVGRLTRRRFTAPSPTAIWPRQSGSSSSQARRIRRAADVRGIQRRP